MIAAVYIVSMCIEKGKLKEFQFLTDANFFVYVLHYLIINKFMKMLVMFLHPSTPAFVLVLYFGVPVIVILICLYKLLDRFTPSFLRVITGGR